MDPSRRLSVLAARDLIASCCVALGLISACRGGWAARTLGPAGCHEEPGPAEIGTKFPLRVEAEFPAFAKRPPRQHLPPAPAGVAQMHRPLVRARDAGTRIGSRTLSSRCAVRKLEVPIVRGRRAHAAGAAIEPNG